MADFFRRQKPIIAFILGICVLAFVRSLNDLHEGDAVPDFTIYSVDGMQHSLSELVQKQDVFLYFIKPDCPFNKDALPFFNDIAKSYAGKGNFYGVIAADPSTYQIWKDANPNEIRMLLDPNLEVIGKLQATHSPWVARVDQSKHLKKAWKGYSADTLLEINQEVARSAGVAPAKLSILGAPERLTHGCPFR